MMEASRVVRNKERVLDAWASRASSVSPEGFQEILGFLDGLDLPKVRPPDVVVKTREPLRGLAAKRAVMGAFKGSRGKRPVKH